MEFTGLSPTVLKGIVYVSSGEGAVYALDAATGSLNWRVDATGRFLTEQE